MGIMEQAFSHPRMVAVGEAGLDKSIEAPLQVQQTFFDMQAHLAERHQKPMIIHCVRAFQEIVAFRKIHQNAPPWIIHGFTGSQQLARQLTDEGFYLSFGSSLIKGHQKTLESLRSIDSGRIFLETDDQPIAIQQVYEQAARQLDISLAGLQKIVRESYNKLFKPI